jgi:hypothetical protein
LDQVTPPDAAHDPLHWATVVSEGRRGRPYHDVVVFHANGEPLNPDDLQAVLVGIAFLDRADRGLLTAYRRDMVRKEPLRG